VVEWWQWWYSVAVVVWSFVMDVVGHSLWLLMVKVSELRLWSGGVVIFYKGVVVVYEMLQCWGSSLVKSKV